MQKSLALLAALTAGLLTVGAAPAGAQAPPSLGLTCYQPTRGKPGMFLRSGASRPSTFRSVPEGSVLALNRYAELPVIGPAPARSLGLPNRVGRAAGAPVPGGVGLLGDLLIGTFLGNNPAWRATQTARWLTGRESDPAGVLTGVPR